MAHGSWSTIQPHLEPQYSPVQPRIVQPGCTIQAVGVDEPWNGELSSRLSPANRERTHKQGKASTLLCAALALALVWASAG